MNKKYYQEIDETLYYKQLPNGLKIFLLPKEEMAKTYSIFSTKYGSIDRTFIPLNEKEKITVPDGVAHFLEHKLFEKETHDVFADFGKQGASANAFTSFTNTAYLFSATNNIDQNIETLLDFVQDPYFSEQSVEKEKGIISQEIKMYDDEPGWQSFMGTVKGMFKNHPVQIDIAGTVDSINTITKEDLYTCYNTFYHPSNMTLFIAGNIEATAVMELIEQNQAKKEFAEPAEISRFFPDEPKEVAKKEIIIPLEVSVPKCTIGIKEFVGELNQEAFLFRDLMQEIVLDHYFSRGGKYYQTLYNENLIDNSFGYSTTLERGFGYSIIGGNAEHPDQFVKRMKELLNQTTSDQLTEKEFTILKRKKIGQLLRAMNSLEYVANQYPHYLEFGADFFELIPFIQQITLTEANEFLKNWIEEEKLTVCKIMKAE